MGQIQTIRVFNGDGTLNSKRTYTYNSLGLVVYILYYDIALLLTAQAWLIILKGMKLKQTAPHSCAALIFE